VPQQQAPVRVRENCEQFRVGAARDSTRIAKNGAVGAMIGAGTGAAGGAIADGGSGAGKGAGIGAVVGAVAGAVHGLTEENARVDGAERAYHDCLARNG
jgi:outer membrane lipoprotein SlyB